MNSAEGKNRVYKIHGCANEEDCNKSQIIITEKDYNNFISQNRFLFYKVYSLFTEKRIIFIGYSINDPNIRSLLNDVIEENNHKVDLEMYWVTIDKMKELDKKYYRDHFNLNIIEECGIVKFLEELRYNLNLEIRLRNLKKDDVKEYTKRFKLDYKNEIMIKKLIDDDMMNLVIEQLYSTVLEHKDKYCVKGSLNPFLALMLHLNSKDLLEYKMKFEDMMSLDSRKIIFTIVRYSYDECEFVKFIKSNGLERILIGEVLYHSIRQKIFEDYADNIEILLKVLNMHKEEIYLNKEEYIKALTYNIKHSGLREKEEMGYSWAGLERLEEYAMLLEEDLLFEITRDMTKSFLTEQDFDGIECLIDNSIFATENKLEARYRFLYKRYLELRIETLIIKFRGKKYTKVSFERGSDEEEMVFVIDKKSQTEHKIMSFGFDGEKIWVDIDEMYEIRDRKSLKRMYREIEVLLYGKFKK